MEYSVIGKRLPRVDGIEKATGSGKFATDVKLPGMLYGKILRSPYAHARITRIDASLAERLSGVKAVITALDPDVPRHIHGMPEPTYVPDEYIFDSRVKFVGDGVAAVAAVSEDIAEEALELMEVEYEPLPAVFDPEEAMKAEAPVIHECMDNNIAKEIHINYGDVEEGFRQSDLIVEGRYTTTAQQHCPIEPHVCVASVDPNGKATVWVSTQGAFTHRMPIAGALGWPVNRVRMINPGHVGGGFGSKQDVYQQEPLAILLSMKSGRPVRMEHTREEEFASNRTRHPFVVYLKTGVKKDGTLLARYARAIVKLGAFANQGPGVMGYGAVSFASLYRTPHVRVDGYAVYTNAQMGGAYRGYGNPQMTFALESQMDEIAAKLGMDPLEFRLKNIVQTGDLTAVGWKIASCGLGECLEKAAERADWRHKRAEAGEGISKKRGIGLACMVHGSGYKAIVPADISGAIIKAHDDGSFSLLVGASDGGTGAYTILAMIAAEELGVRLDDITVVPPDTDVSPVDLGSYASRVTQVTGHATKLAAADMKNQLFRVAAEMLEAAPEDLEAKDRQIRVKGSPERFVSFADVTGRGHYGPNGDIFIAKAGYDPPEADFKDPETGYGNMAPSYLFAAQVAEVEVDTETGQVEVLKMVAAHDVGKAINPMQVEGQIEGALHHGIGYGLTEEVVSDKTTGRVLNPNFLDYKILSALDMPKVETIIVEPIDPNGPFGAKGCGEPGLVPTAPALANAVYNAVGVRINDLPLTPEKILKALKEKGSA